MGITELYNLIIEKLNKSGYETIAEDLERLLAAAATGGEGLSSTGRYLFDLQAKKHEAYDLIKDLIAEYLKYCRRNGINIG
jgi:hypothetical protein